MTGNGGVVLYVGANNSGAKIDVPTGPLNYMSDAHVSPSFFPAGYSGFLHKYAFANPPATLSWFISDNATSYHVELSTNAATAQCKAGAVLLVTLTYEMASDLYASVSQQAASTILAYEIGQNTGMPTSSILNPGWTQTATGFTVTFELYSNDQASNFGAAATIAALAGEHATNTFTTRMNAAIGVTPVSLAHIVANGTSTDTVGTEIVPVAPAPVAPVPQPPMTIPTQPLIPFADCWEQRSSYLYMYFGYNNTGTATINVPEGATNNIFRLPEQAALGTVTSFAPGFSSFAKVVTINTPPTRTPDARWSLLNHEVKMITRGVLQECKQTESAKVWIVFAGSDATALTKVNDITNLIITSVPNLQASQVSVTVNSSGQPATFRLEVVFTRAGVTQYRAAADLYQAFYHGTTLATGLQTLAGAAPTGLHGQPTSVEVQGTSRLTPIPVANPQSGTPSGAPSSHKLGGGAIFGIIIGVVAGIALIAGVILYLRKNPPNANGRSYDKLIQ